MGYLPFMIPIALGIAAFATSRADDRWWLILLWVMLVAGLLYAPISTQRRYLLGVQTPLAVWAAFGWSRAVLPRLGVRWRPLVTTVYMIFAAIAPILLLLSNINAAVNPLAQNSPFYSPDELAGYAWLQREANNSDLVLTTFDQRGQGSGGRLVAATGQRVFIGHWIETAHFEEKIEQLQIFYDPATDDEWRQDFLHETGVVYVWYDDYARQFGDWDPASASYLEVVLTTGSVTIYRVLNDAP
jgi:hypothetical protein